MSCVPQLAAQGLAGAVDGLLDVIVSDPTVGDPDIDSDGDGKVNVTMVDLDEDGAAGRAPR